MQPKVPRYKNPQPLQKSPGVTQIRVKHFLAYFFTRRMKFIHGEVLKACQRKWRRRGKSVGVGSLCNELSHWVSWWWPFSAHEDKREDVPEDVPKGHVAVYVGEEHKRYVIKISLLRHSLLQALLDQAHDSAYDIATEPKLCVPCNEYVFMEVVRCANIPEHGRLLMCR